MKPKATNIVWHEGAVPSDQRTEAVGQQGVTLWFTGLSGSGKSTVAVEVERRLLELGLMVYRLDGDNVRHGLNANLGFSPEDRQENIRRVGEVSKLFCDACVITLVSFISPYQKDRDQARKLHEDAGLLFGEVHVDVPLEVAESRDPKGLYKKARAGEIPEFTGISAPYEAPHSPEIHLVNHDRPLEDVVEDVLEWLTRMKIIKH